MRAGRLLGLLVSMSVAGTAAAASGEYWDLKTRMSMQGMSIPATENRVCKPTDAQDDEMVPPSGDDAKCRPTAFQTRGNKTTYRFECTGKDAVSGEGEIERLGPDAYRGRTVMRTEDGEMTMEFEGRKAGGACDPEAPMKQIQAQMAQSQAQACRSQGAALQPPERNPQLPPEMDFGCDAANKAAYCDGVKEKHAGIKDQRDFQSVSANAGWRRPLSYCGLDPDALERRFCDAAVGNKDYHYIASACETDARRIAAQCAGRDGTSLAAAGQSDLLPVCAKYGPGAPVMVEQGAGGDPAVAGGGEQAVPPAKESTFDKLKKGTKGLKDLIKIPGT